MDGHSWRWHLMVLPGLGIVVMLGGIALLLFRHDDDSGYSLLVIGAAIFGTSGIGTRRSNKRGPGC